MLAKGLHVWLKKAEGRPEAAVTAEGAWSVRPCHVLTARQTAFLSFLLRLKDSGGCLERRRMNILRDRNTCRQMT